MAVPVMQLQMVSHGHHCQYIEKLDSASLSSHHITFRFEIVEVTAKVEHVTLTITLWLVYTINSTQSFFWINVYQMLGHQSIEGDEIQFIQENKTQQKEQSFSEYMDHISETGYREFCISTQDM